MKKLGDLICIAALLSLGLGLTIMIASYFTGQLEVEMSTVIYSDGMGCMLTAAALSLVGMVLP